MFSNKDCIEIIPNHVIQISLLLQVNKKVLIDYIILFYIVTA